MAVIGSPAPLPVTHPRYWPMYGGPAAAFTITNNATSYPLTGSTAWSYLNGMGGTNTDIKSANTYYTLADVTGRGIMGTVVGYTGDSSGSMTYTLRVTTDGVEEVMTYLNTSSTDEQRALIGHAMHRPAGTINYTMTPQFVNQSGVAYWETLNTGGTYIAAPSFITLLPAYKMAQTGMPVHTFNKSLKVELQGSKASTTNAYLRNAGVTYLLNPVAT